MLREHAKAIDQLSQLSDLVIITLAFFLTIELYRKKSPATQTILDSYFQIFIVFLLAWIFFANSSNIYGSRRLTTLRTELTSLIKIHALALVTTLAILPLLYRGPIQDRFIYYFATGSLALTALTRTATRLVLQHLRQSGRNTKYALLLGNSHSAQIITDSLRHYPQLGYQIIGCIAPENNTDLDIPWLGDYTHLEQALTQNIVDVVIVADSIHNPQIRESLELAHIMGKTAVAIMNDDIYRLSHMRPFQLAGIPMVAMYNTTRYEWQELLKKIFDIILATLGLILTAPLMLGIALAIRLTSPGPILFVQKRVGLNCRTFNMYKFRTMVPNAEELKTSLSHLNEMSGPVFKIKDDPRVPPIGRFLRKTSRDELPPRWDVRGPGMSLVGPRPPLPSEVNLYNPSHRKRLSVKPGITCIWQISGRNDIDFDKWMEMDAEYVDNWSLGLDLKILAKTLPVVIGKKGAS
jgi:exopolysaccharide biosynthesis polyprenyl glycosylphosphotransferase